MARIDLHGMTLAEAHSAVQAFLERCFANGTRRAEIVTGKGGEGSGTLRYEVPRWLEVSPWPARISSVTHAPQKEGGAGVLRVLFKKPRHDR